MLEVLKTSEGEIKAVCEYYVVSETGAYHPKGLYCWINEFEIAPKYKNNGILDITKEFLTRILKKEPQLQFGYFWRQYKYPNRRPHIYSKRQWLKRLEELF